MSVPIVHLRDVQPRAGIFTVWERRRHSKPLHWLMECFAESLGVFFYVYAGVGSTAAFVIGSFIQQGGLSSFLQIGFAYAFGILLAITICGGTSGGHFNPCVTISFVVFKGFPKLKACRYIVAQIFGAFIACLLIHVQYGGLIALVEEGQAAKGVLDAIQFTPSGTGGILGLYVTPGSNLGRVFLNEFVTDVVLGLVIWGCIDPTNAFIPPFIAPWIVSFAYAAMIWSYGVTGLAANSARDIGGRLANMAIYGTKAAGGRYAAIAALTNIPAMLFAALLYEIFLTDSDRVVPREHLEFITVHRNHRRNPDAAHSHSLTHVTRDSPSIADEKGRSETFEHVPR